MSLKISLSHFLDCALSIELFYDIMVKHTNEFYNSNSQTLNAKIFKHLCLS